MFVYGKRPVERTLGRVADFCPFCREITPHRMVRIGYALHVYCVALTVGDEIGRYVRCVRCHSRWERLGPEYTGIASGRVRSIDELIERTNPDIREEFADRLAVEQQIVQGLVAVEGRHELLLEPFLLLDEPVEQRAKATQVDFVSGVLLLLGAVAGVSWVAMNTSGRAADLLVRSAIGLASLVLFGLAIAALATDLRRYINRIIMPRLVRALRPLQPTREELETTMARLREEGLAIGRRLPAETLCRRLGV